MIRSKPSCSDSVMLYEANTLTLPGILIAVHIEERMANLRKITNLFVRLCKTKSYDYDFTMIKQCC